MREEKRALVVAVLAENRGRIKVKKKKEIKQTYKTVKPALITVQI